MSQVEQISASVRTETIDDIKALAEKERRSFSSMVDILLKEAVDLRISKKHKQ